eukprot:12457000-Ditylum_brightwellii.AAC.1
MANIRSDADVTLAMSKRYHFEVATTYLLLVCLMLRKFTSGTKHDAIKISDTTASGFGTKPSVGTSGVILMYHTSE